MIRPRRGLAASRRGFLQATAALTLGGCWSAGAREATVYAALDSEFSQPIFEEYQRQSGATILAKFDTEAAKTVGLANAILAETSRPRCDVFWNNEILNTLRLEAAGALEPYSSQFANRFPVEFQSPTAHWCGFAARARVLLVNAQRVAESDHPRYVTDLLDPRWQGQVAIAKPLFGTTATHAACLFAALGAKAAENFFLAAQRNGVQIHPGNKQVAQAVSSGAAAWGLTDTDDAAVEIDKGQPVRLVFPDQGADALGTLLIPNTLALIRGAPHLDEGKKLIDYLLAGPVEDRLAQGPSAQFPLSTAATGRSRLAPAAPLKSMKIDFSAAAAQWDAAQKFLRDTFTAPT
ncbi:MAG TPA: extracellular solute-binding protein [Pirellulales bacterium]